MLPDHDHPAHLHSTRDGWQYWCAACNRSFSLAEVRAVLAYADIPFGDARDNRPDPAWRRVRLPGPVEVSRWHELLRFEVGEISPRPVDLIDPGNLSEVARAALTQLRLLLGLRSVERWRDTAEFTYARRLCMARTGLSADMARAALVELQERRIIVPIGKTGKALLYRLGTREDVYGEGGNG